MTTTDLISLVLDDYARNGCRTAHSVISHSKHILRLLPEIPRTAKEVDDYTVKRLSEGAKPATVGNELTILRRGFRLASKYDLVDKVPVITAPHVENVRTQTCTGRQAKMIVAALDVLDPDVADLVRWLLLMGWRQGESRRLVWDDFEHDRSAVKLPQRKSKNRRVRYVLLGETTRDLIDRRWRLRDGPYVFHRHGRQIRIFRGSWQRAVTGAGCPELRPHDPRRTFAQVATDQGIAAPVIMQIAGWKTMSTFHRYAIVRGDMQASAQERVANVVTSPAATP